MNKGRRGAESSNHRVRIGGQDGEVLDCTIAIYTPREKGKYPAIQFQHGFAQRVSDYSEFLNCLAQRGFVVVAPQMYSYGFRTLLPGGSPSPNAEGLWVRRFTTWLCDGSELHKLLPKGIHADPRTVFLVGHSRGAQACWLSLDRRLPFPPVPPPAIRAACGVDPVEGSPDAMGRLAPVLFRDAADKVDLSCPSLVLGASAGGQGPFPAAPPGHNYEEFAEKTVPQPRLTVVPSTGHLDICMDDPRTLFTRVQRCVVERGANPRASRLQAAGLVASFCESVARGARRPHLGQGSSGQDVLVGLPK